MNQIVIGIEVSIAEEWQNVQEALTDTARILQTYENEGRAPECIHFLQDSYEILCLMVGDLIVDNVRSGVMQKWHERYEAATGEVAKAGLALVSDDAQEDNASAPSSQVKEETPDGSVPLDQPNALDMDIEDHAIEETVADELDADETETEADETEPEDFTALAQQEEEVTVAEDFQEATSPFDSSEDSAEDSLDTGDLPSMDELINMQTHVTGQVEEAQDDIFDEHPREEQEATAIESPHDIDLLVPEEDAPSKEEVILPFEEPPSIESEPQTDEVAGPDTTSEVDAEDFYTGVDIDDIEVTDLEVDASAAQDEPSIELIAEVDTEPETIEDVQELVIIEPIEAEPDVIEDVQESAETEPIEFEPGSPEALLQTARDAMSRGDIADAKALALELAASMARIEVERAEARVADAERQLRTNEEAISTAEVEVSDSEETLNQAEVRVAEHQTLLQDKHEQVEEFHNKVEAAAESVRDLEAQIATLQQRHTEETEHLGQIETSLDQKQAEESRAQSELDDMIAEEQSAQDRSDEVREEVAELKKAQTDHKNTIRETQAEFAHRQESVNEIVDTIEHVTDTKHKLSDEGEMLP